MNYTTNYHLPQWEESDRVLMQDFNAAMAGIEGGLTTGFSPRNMPYAVGSYVGQGDDVAIEIELGFHPRFVFITGIQDGPGANVGDHFRDFAAATAGTSISKRIWLTDAGFTVRPRNYTDEWLPDLNNKGREYDYIAFR